MSMNHVTIADLERSVCRINVECIGYTTCNPYGFEDPKRRVGMYVLSGAYGGWELQRIVNERGGVESVFNCGHVTKRALWVRLQAMIDGIHAIREADRVRAAEAREERERMEAFLNRPRA